MTNGRPVLQAFSAVAPEGEAQAHQTPFINSMVREIEFGSPQSALPVLTQLRAILRARRN